MYTCVYIYIYIYIHIHMYIYIYIYISCVRQAGVRQVAPPESFFPVSPENVSVEEMGTVGSL